MTRRFGFTLAEVLITLGIIGVVAAMTIPTLMNNVGRTEFKTGFKKIVSTLNQAVTMNVALDDSDFSNTTAGGGTAAGSLYALFSGRMNVLRTTTGTENMGLTANNYTLFFNDGMAISFGPAVGACTAAAPCNILVDVNGLKRPNSLTNCTSGAACSGTMPTDLNVSDQFAVELAGQQASPANEPARQVLFR